MSVCHLTDWNPRLKRREEEEARMESVFMSLCFLSVDLIWPVVLPTFSPSWCCSLPDVFLGIMDYTLKTVSPNKPFLAWVSVSGILPQQWAKVTIITCYTSLSALNSPNLTLVKGHKKIKYTSSLQCCYPWVETERPLLFCYLGIPGTQTHLPQSVFDAIAKYLTLDNLQWKEMLCFQFQGCKIQHWRICIFLLQHHRWKGGREGKGGEKEGGRRGDKLQRYTP